MALFGNPMEKARGMVGDAIKGLGGNPDQAKVRPDTWLVGKGSAAVVVRLVPQDERSKSGFLQVASPVMRAPPTQAFHERLLRLNFEMGGLATFGVTPQNEVHLTTARTLDGISPTEIAQLMAQIAHFSDLYDDKLLTEFGRQYALHQGQRG